jgi:hypothetical protein
VSDNKELFLFAAKTGSLEGYLYDRKKLEPLDNWVGNIERMYAGLPDSDKEGFKDEFGGVLERILAYGEKILPENIKARLSKLLLSL